MQKGAVQHKAGAGSGNAWTLKYVPRKGSFGQKNTITSNISKYPPKWRLLTEVSVNRSGLHKTFIF